LVGYRFAFFVRQYDDGFIKITKVAVQENVVDERFSTYESESDNNIKGSVDEDEKDG
jgi:hypothetical protein